MDPRHTASRRHFLQAAGLGAATTALWGSHPRNASAKSEKPSGKAKFTLGLASYTTRKFSLDETLAMSKRLRLTYLCFKSFHLPLDASKEQIDEAVAKVKEAGLVLYGGGVISMGSKEQVDQAFNYAKLAGMNTIVGVPMPDVLPLVEEKVKEYDIQVAIHNHGPGDKTYPLPQTAYERIKNLDKRIGLCIDIGHVIRYERDPVEAIKTCQDRVLDIHLKDVDQATAKGKACVAGHGVIDLPAVLKTLIEIGFDRHASFEYEQHPDDPMPGLAESVGYIRGLLRMM